MASNCESCMNYEYDEEYEYYVCIKNLDEDEMYKFLTDTWKNCPYYRNNDEYECPRECDARRSWSRKWSFERSWCGSYCDG